MIVCCTGCAIGRVECCGVYRIAWLRQCQVFLNPTQSICAPCMRAQKKEENIKKEKLKEASD